MTGPGDGVEHCPAVVGDSVQPGGCADCKLVCRYDVELVLPLLLREHVHRGTGIVIIADTAAGKNKNLYNIVPGVRAGDTLQQKGSASRS